MHNSGIVNRIIFESEGEEGHNNSSELESGDSEAESGS